MQSTLLPRMKQSPYLAFIRPSTYSSLCSMAMFMNPSRQESMPLYCTPLFNCTITGLPITLRKKSLGFFFPLLAGSSLIVSI